MGMGHPLSLGLVLQAAPHHRHHHCRKAPLKRAGGPAAKRKKAADGGCSGTPEEPANSLKGVFSKDLVDIMVAFGESTNRPLEGTLDALEGITIEFVRNTIARALENVRPHSCHLASCVGAPASTLHCAHVIHNHSLTSICHTYAS
jgi:hypothetical protein